jgi:Tol biopolymer transport system component
MKPKPQLLGRMFSFPFMVMTAFGLMVASVCGGSPQLLSQPYLSAPSSVAGNGDSVSPWISPDGRFVLFSSHAVDLVTNDHGYIGQNVFLCDRSSNTVALVSANYNGTGGANGTSLGGQVSTNGRYALFVSDATDLLPGDTNGFSHVFVRDLLSATNILVSVATDGTFGNGPSSDPVMTPDGRWVAFVSSATNLVAGVTNGIMNLFLRDLVNGITTQVTAAATGASVVLSSPVITPDGRYVAFASSATGMVAGGPAYTEGEIYLYDSVLNKMTWTSTNASLTVSNFLHLINTSINGHFPDMPSSHPVISNDGRYVAYRAGWTNGLVSPGGSAVAAVIVFQYDSVANTTTILSTNGYPPWPGWDDVYGPAMTPDGRFVAYVQLEPSGTTNYSGVFLWDRLAGTNVLVSADANGLWPTNSTSLNPALSQDGRYVTFMSDATTLVSNTVSSGQHIYRRDLQTATTVLVDVDTNNAGSEDQTGTIPSMSADGQSVAFSALDGGLIVGDNNNAADVFLWNAAAGTNVLISAHNLSVTFQSGNLSSTLGPVSVSGNGGLVAFASYANNLIPNDFNGDADVFVHNLPANTNILVSVGLDGNSGQGGPSYNPVISADGRYVIFDSFATNLVAGDTNGAVDVFRRDLQTGTTVQLSLYFYTNGTGANNIGTYPACAPVCSLNGRYVAFDCFTNLPSAGALTNQLCWRDMNSGLTILWGGPNPNHQLSMSASGQRVAFFDNQSLLYVWDANLKANIYTNTTSGITSAALSPDGNRLLYLAANQLFVYDLNAGTNLFLCPSTVQIKGSSQWSGDGRYVAFVTATNLIGNDNNGTNDVYLLDYQTGNLTLVSMNQGGTASAAGSSDWPVVSTDGRFVAFRSLATDIVSGIVNPPSLIVYDRLAGTNSLLVTGTTDTGWTSWVSQPALSADQSHLAFLDWDAGLVSGDLNGAGDVFAGGLNNLPALDSDSDGIPDWWMIEYFGHPTGQAGDLSLAQDDADGDGMSNLQEYLAGTDPTVPTSVLALNIAPVVLGTSAALTWTAAPGKTYQLLSTTNLSNAVWSVVPGSAGAGAAGAMGGLRSFTIPATNAPCYFRILCN